MKTGNGVQRSSIAVPDPSSMACLNNPCMNNGLCRPDPDSDKGFKCICVSDYKGILCEGWWNTMLSTVKALLRPPLFKSPLSIKPQS